MADPACTAEIEEITIRFRQSYESGEMLAQHVWREAFRAIRAREELEARHKQGTQALEDARHHEQSARKTWKEAEQARRRMFDELQRLEALLQSVRAGNLR